MTKAYFPESEYTEMEQRAGGISNNKQWAVYECEFKHNTSTLVRHTIARDEDEARASVLAAFPISTADILRLHKSESSDPLEKLAEMVF